MKIILALVVVVLLSGYLFYEFSQRGFYRPGQLATQQRNVKSQQGHYLELDDGVRLYSEVFGTPVKGTIVAVHGGPGYPATERWDALIPLEQHYRVVYYHQRGAGLSDRPFTPDGDGMGNFKLIDQKLGVAQHLLDLQAVIKHYQQGPVTVIGHSFGGLIAMLYASEFPKSINQLVLISPANMIKTPHKDFDYFKTMGSFLPETERSSYQEFLSQYMDFKNLFKRSSEDMVNLDKQLGNFAKHAWGNQGYDDAFFERFAYPIDWMAHGLYISMGYKHDYTDAVKSINLPTLIIHGQKDLLPSRMSRNIDKLISNSVYLELPDVGHFSFWEKPQLVTEKLTEFMNAG